LQGDERYVVARQRTIHFVPLFGLCREELDTLMSRWLAYFGTMLCCHVALAADPIAYPKPEPNSADERIATKFSSTKAASFLDATSVNWSRDRKCVTCHTNVPYLMARSALGTESPALNEVRAFFEVQVAGPEEGRARDGAYFIASAVALACNDAQNGKLQPVTREALDRVWTLQQKDGAWDWIKCGWPPMEEDDYYGATLVAVAVGMAPDNYSRSEKARVGLERLRGYFKATPPPNLHHKAMLLWASAKVENLMTAKERDATVKELLAIQREDGGWSLPSLGDWTRRDSAENDKKAPSDGYATGLAVYVLRQTGVPIEADAIQRGVTWLKGNQRESGRWFTRSLNTDHYHFISHAGTAYAVLALTSCDALKE
jgi:squalene-hopene/tetraprenyl-beta-curcumene cyclase